MATRSKQTKKTSTPKSSNKNTSKTTRPAVAKANVTTQKKDNSTPLKIKKSYVIIAIIVLGVLGLAFKYRNAFLAATVNGIPISRLSILKASERQICYQSQMPCGRQVLDTAIQNMLVEQEGQKRGITISDKEIDDEIKKYENAQPKSGPSFDEALASAGLTRKDLRRLVRVNKIIGKVVGKDVKVTDKQVSDYIEQNKESLPTGMTDEQLKATVSAQLKQLMLKQKAQDFLNELKSKAKIEYFVQY